MRIYIITGILFFVTFSASAYAQEKKTGKPAIVFLVAGQSNAGGAGILSPESYKENGDILGKEPLMPGSTAKEVGLPINASDYTHSYIWVPDSGFQRIIPELNLKPPRYGIPCHGMELPVVWELEKRFPENDIYVVKFGPGATNLYHDWNPKRLDGKYGTWLGYYSKAMAQLSLYYPEVRVIGLYWDQGESDGLDNKAGEYANKLREFTAAVRHDTHLPRLKIFIRKHIFDWPNIDTIIAAQEQVVEQDSLCYLLDIDLGDREKNYKAWDYRLKYNSHVSSKGFVELTRSLFDGPLNDATVQSFEKYEHIADTSNISKLTVISEHRGPVIGPNHPDVKASNNKGGFETGQLVKHKGVYHMFVNEMFGRPHLDLRISHWSSSDAINWKRQSTLVESVPGRSHTNLRSEVWLTGVEYNEEEDAWNIFYVAYRGGDPDKDENFNGDYKGRIWRARSKLKGPDGIAGLYEDIEVIMQPDENTQTWEGGQAVDSFNPYKAGDKWYAFYGGHYHIPRGPWPVGMAVAPRLSGPWERMPEGFNPVPIVEEFAENPIVSKLDDGRYLAIFDSFGDQEVAYSISEDGVNWVPETRLKVQSGNNFWAEDGDHYTRTPLCAIQEDDGTFTVIYTAMMMVDGNRFYAVGKCTLGWE